MSTVQSQVTLETISYHPSKGWSVNPLPQHDSDRTLVLVFGAKNYLENHQPLAELRDNYPNAHFLGCSTAGEIHGDMLKDDSLTVAIYRFEHTKLVSATAAISAPTESLAAGKAIANQLMAPDLKGIFVLSDGVIVNGSDLVNGLNAVVPESVVVSGGLAADGDRFQQTWTMCDGMPESGMVSAIGFYGDRIQFGHGCKGGWNVFGPERVVTRSKDNILFELDGKPSLPLYKEYLGDRAKGLPATALLFPLSIWNQGEEDTKLVRTILSVDEANQSMTFAGNIPEGSIAQLMQANFDRLIEGAAESALMTNNSQHNNSPCLAIAISCVGRRLVLGERSEEELESTLEAMQDGTQQIGYYSYGEISPFTCGKSTLHNQTMTMTTITEW